MKAVLGQVSLPCRQRLRAHYGPSVGGWLDQVPEIIAIAADEWGLRPEGYHDAGHASVLVVAATAVGDSVLLKAWFEQDRYRNEIEALRHWELVNGRVVRYQNDRLAVACLELIGAGPGGGTPPADEARQVAEALARLHSQPLPRASWPKLHDYVSGTVEPRIRQRLRRFHSIIPSEYADIGLGRESTVMRRPVLLHADLYQENVLFARNSRPVFIDPLPMVGDPVFDWAFFTVYFNLASDPIIRLRLAREVSRIDGRELLSACLLLCIDGLLYYHEVGDDREPRMSKVIGILADAYRIC